MIIITNLLIANGDLVGKLLKKKLKFIDNGQIFNLIFSYKNVVYVNRCILSKVHNQNC